MCLLKHVVFILCLEKIELFGIYVVAFRQAFKKSLRLTPMIILLFSGFILSFKLQSSPLNERFNHTNVGESVAQLGKMLLAGIDDTKSLGMQSKSLTNYTVFFVFVVLVPILLINLLIGVSTGELKETLDISNVIRYQMQLNFILGWQHVLLEKFGLKCCNDFFLFKIYTGKYSQKKKNIHSNDKSKDNLESQLDKLEQKQNRNFELMNDKLSQLNKVVDLKLSQQTNKIQTMQDGILERINQHEKLMGTQLDDFEQNSTKQMNSMASDLINKS